VKIGEKSTVILPLLTWIDSRLLEKCENLTSAVHQSQYETKV